MYIYVYMNICIYVHMYMFITCILRQAIEWVVLTEGISISPAWGRGLIVRLLCVTTDYFAWLSHSLETLVLLIYWENFSRDQNFSPLVSSPFYLEPKLILTSELKCWCSWDKFSRPLDIAKYALKIDTFIAYLIFVIFVTQARFSEPKSYTEKCVN